jgi:hypothetical protein
VDAREHLDVAASPRLGRVSLKVGGRDALAVREISDPRVIARNAAVCVICAVDLERPERLAAVAYDWTVPA